MHRPILRSFFTLPVHSQLWVLFALGFAARLAVTLFLADNRTLFFEHMLIAKNLLDGKGYVWDEWGRATLQVSSMIPPLYVYWCAFFMWLSPANYAIMYVLRFAIVLLYRTGEEMPQINTNREVYPASPIVLVGLLHGNTSVGGNS